MQKNIKFVSGVTGNVLNCLTISCDADEKIMREKVKQAIVESLSGGKDFETVEHDIANINDWSMFGNSGDQIIIEDV